MYYQKAAPDFVARTEFDLGDIEEDYDCFQILSFGPNEFGIDCIFANYTNFWVFVQVDRDTKTPPVMRLEYDDVEEHAVYKRKMYRSGDIIIRAP